MKDKMTNNDEQKKIAKNICEECGSPMQPEGGCFVCPNCGYSPCSI